MTPSALISVIAISEVQMTNAAMYRNVIKTISEITNEIVTEYKISFHDIDASATTAFSEDLWLKSVRCIA